MNKTQTSKSRNLFGDAVEKIMITKEAIASCALDGQTQCGTIEPKSREFNLSEKEERCMCEAIEQSEVYQEKDVKEFIRLLKEINTSKIFSKVGQNDFTFMDAQEELGQEISNLAGDKLK